MNNNQLVYDQNLNRLNELHEEANELLTQIQMEDPIHRRMGYVLKGIHEIATKALLEAYFPNK